MDLTARLLIALIGLMAAQLVASAMGSCAVDRLEQQVIRNTRALERLERSHQQLAAPSPRRGAPGEPTGLRVTGWGGREAELLFVEGAAEGAPLRLSEKPLPQGDAYVRRLGSPLATLNAYVTDDNRALRIAEHTLEPMLLIDPDHPTEVLPALATAREVSEDGLTLTFHLRRGVRFADGRPLSADDVRFSFEVVRDPGVSAGRLKASLEDVLAVHAPDPHTVEVRLARPSWRALYAVGVGLPVLNRGWYEEHIPAYARRFGVDDPSTVPGEPGFAEVFNRIRVPCPGAGPYQLADEDFGRVVELEQNPFYYGVQVRPGWWNLRRLRWVVISDEVAAFEAFRKGELDLITVDHDAWEDQHAHDPTLTRDARHLTYDHLNQGVDVIVWNHRRPPFDDPRVRRAMTHLVDRRWMVDALLRGRGRVATCLSKPTFPNYPLDLTPLDHDLDAARALLDEAGWIDSDGDGVRDRDGQRFEVELTLIDADGFDAQWTAQLLDAAAQAGIRMRRRSLEFAVFMQAWEARSFDGAAVVLPFKDPFVDLSAWLHASEDRPGGQNAAGWRSAEADALLDAMRAEPEAGARDALFRQLCALMQRDQPLTLLVHREAGVLQSARFQGARVRPTGLSAHGLWVAPEDQRHE